MSENVLCPSRIQKFDLNALEGGSFCFPPGICISGISIDRQSDTRSCCSHAQSLLTGVWEITYIPTAPQPDTYSVVSQQRIGSCNTVAGTELCSESDNIYLYSSVSRLSLNTAPCYRIPANVCWHYLFLSMTHIDKCSDMRCWSFYLLLVLYYTCDPVS